MGYVQERAAHLVRGDQARARILESAGSAFARQGFNGSSLDRIAQDAGITKPGLLHHFATKLDLLHAVLTARENEALADVGREPSSLRVFDTLLAVARRDVADEVRTRGFAVLLGEAVATESPAADWFRHHYASLSDEITSAIRAATASGHARPDTDAGGIAAETIALMDGLQTQWLLSGDSETYLRRLAHALERVRRDISVAPGTSPT
ncbi:AcrR family transcriptional regulator [Microbacterium sp. SORGH_AS 1204]|uniref:TetR/AcrR family transcriptional regulator n=1 Tax=Microbacterium sp. SORGH_AS_1204 TaxID=3041785 RepID=UPI00278CEDD0|nr:TetR/AcrR family transcriptional regulator [Microbacterium sp. SORGH_AS_1204]MDQ1136298.1 AcrR family transcriptional regulator [Microbacterium sp. SORGH_AS_1204]